jgi:two-component system, sensor histidine kinase LadS
MPSVIYMKIDPGNARVFVAELNTYENFVAHSLEEYFLLGLFYGFILMIGAYNFGLYISIGERQYLYYVFYTVSVCLFFMYHDGLGFQFIWPHNPAWRDKVLTYSLFGIIIWTIFYSKWFLDYKNRMPLINTILGIILIVISGILLTTFIFPGAYEYFLIPVTAASYLLIYISGFRIYIDGYKPAGYFLLAYSFLFLGFIIRLLTFFNYFLETMFTVYSYNAGILIEMTLFSIAIGYRIKTIKQEREAALVEKDLAHRETIKHLKENEILKDKVNKELEEKVAQRTEELKNKNAELETANQKLNEQTDKANQWNIRLDLDNRSLQQNMKDLSKARVVMKEVTFSEFSEVFPDNDACYKYLAELKWKDGYKCRKCSNRNFGRGKTIYSRRCTKCHYEESCTSGTLFHHLKFPITKAFYMCYLVSIRDVTSDELSELLSLRRETCWSFRKKIIDAKKSKKAHKNDSTDEWGLLALISLTDHHK